MPTGPTEAVRELLVCGQWWLLPNRGQGIALEMRPNLAGIWVWVGEGVSRLKLLGFHVVIAVLQPTSRVAQGRASGRCCFLPLARRSSVMH